MTYTMSMQPVNNKLADIMKEIGNTKIGGVSENFIFEDKIK